MQAEKGTSCSRVDCRLGRGLDRCEGVRWLFDRFAGDPVRGWPFVVHFWRYGHDLCRRAHFRKTGR